MKSIIRRYIISILTKLNSAALVCKQTILTERPPHIGEALLRIADVTWSEHGIPTAVNVAFLYLLCSF
jgi:hypothetical protein